MIASPVPEAVADDGSASRLHYSSGEGWRVRETLKTVVGSKLDCIMPICTWKEPFYNLSN